MLRADAAAAAHDGRIQGAAGRSRSAPPTSTSPSGYLQPGIVLVGDAFSTSCPAAGTGTTKVFTDVERLCNVYIPQWLATDGMDAQKIAQFYDDPEKVACETRCLEKAYHLRSLSTDNGLSWRAQRWARFLVRLAQGTPGARSARDFQLDRRNAARAERTAAARPARLSRSGLQRAARSCAHSSSSSSSSSSSCSSSSSA